METVSRNRKPCVEIAGQALFALLFAGDVVLISSNEAHLQRSLNLAVQFIAENGLILNEKKCFGMVVKGNKRKNVKLTVKAGDHDIRQVDTFEYLGYCMNEKLSPKISSVSQLEKANRALYSFFSKIKSLPPGCPFKIAQQLFHATVTSVAEYGSEISGPNPGCDELQMKMIKKFFQIRKSAPVSPVYQGTVTFPLRFRLVARQLKFLVQAANRPDGSLVEKALLCAITSAKKQKKSLLRLALAAVEKFFVVDWSDEEENLLRSIALLNTGTIIKFLENDFSESLSEELATNASRKGKLWFLFQVMPRMQRSVFVDVLPTHLACWMWKLLTSSHHFRIETGRWVKLEKESRLCRVCEAVEDEYHALFFCPKYQIHRDKLLESLAMDRPQLIDACVELFRMTVYNAKPANDPLFAFALFVREILKGSYNEYYLKSGIAARDGHQARSSMGEEHVEG